MPAELRVPNPGDVSGSPSHDLRGVLAIAPFRRLWLALAFSSLGDWIGLLATTAMAQSLGGSYSSGLFAVSGVLALRMVPTLLFGPFAGAFADRFDRRLTMVVCDVIRFALYATIPVVGTLPYLLGVVLLIEAFSLFWIPAKEASVPNLVPRERLEAANQLSLVTTYAMAPVAAAVFALMAVISRAVGHGAQYIADRPNALALWFDAGTFAVSAFTIASLAVISEHHREGKRSDDTEARQASTGMLASIVEGWRFVRTTPMVRGLVVGILGAFTAGGAVVGLGRPYVGNLGGGNASWGLIFGSVFLGLAAGMLVGPRTLPAFSRRRLFGLSIAGAGLTLAITSVLPNLVVAMSTTLVVGAFAGLAWVTGYTLLGGEVDDAVRGRTFALVQSLIRVDLLVVLASAPAIAGAIGPHSVGVAKAHVRIDGVTVVLFAAGLLAAAVGVVSFRQMDDRPGVPVIGDLLASMRGRRYRGQPHLGGLFLAFEGGEGAGKSTQVKTLAEWLRGMGFTVVVTREPGATDMGRKVRELLLDNASVISPRAEALLYAADRAAHVELVIEPALRRGEVVITDRYVDSSLAYQGAGRALPNEEIAELSRWATGGLRPDLTILLDIDPAIGLRRGADPHDRIEAEGLDFHRRVRAGFLALAEARPMDYLVVDAGQAPDAVGAAIRARLAHVRQIASRTSAFADTGADERAAAPVAASATTPGGGAGAAGER